MSEVNSWFLGGGCFWCLEAVFQRLKGVDTVVSGYMGGSLETANYRQVCSGTTGHAEIVKVLFSEEKIPSALILDVFFTIHDPTTANRQGADVGSQYRSVIFYQSPEQQAEAESACTRAQALWPQPLVTEILPALPFYPAEDYHQNYFNLHPEQRYCQAVVAPKVAKFRQKFSAFFL